MMNDNSTPERVSRALMIAGTALASLSVAAWGLNFLPVIPAWLIQLAIYKLTFISGAGLIIGGATLRRSLRLNAPQRPPELGDGEDR